MSTPGKLVLVRHGQSVWNLENLFTGWTDVDLADQGRDEAARAGRQLLEEKLVVDVAFTSVLKRAIRTLWIMLDEMDRMWIPVERSWRLNERHYGALQGLDKAQTVERHGADQVKIWRRSYDIPPPPLATDDERHPRFDPRYADVPRNAGDARRRCPAAASVTRVSIHAMPTCRPRSFPLRSRSRTHWRGCCPSGTAALLRSCAAGATCSWPRTATVCARW